MGEWQPIATAPKDGTPVLLYRPKWAESVVTGRWDSDWERWRVDGGMFPSRHLTHWMPLPEPPDA